VSAIGPGISTATTELMSPAVANGKVYVCGKDVSGKDGNFSFDAANGHFGAKHLLSGAWGPPTVANGVVYAVVGGSLYAFSEGDLQPMPNWATPSVYGLASIKPAVAGGFVYASTDEGSSLIAAFDLSKNGKLLWTSSKTGNTTTCSPAVGDGRVYVGSTAAPYLQAAFSGASSWTQAWASSQINQPIQWSAAVANGVVYAAEQKGGAGTALLHAVDAQTGMELSHYPVALPVDSFNTTALSSPAAANGVVYVGTDGTVAPLPKGNTTKLGTFYAVNAATGQPGNPITIPSGIYGDASHDDGNTIRSPTVVNGTVFVTTDYPAVYAFRPK
jgi:hypothetical protein